MIANELGLALVKENLGFLAQGLLQVKFIDHIVDDFSLLLVEND